MKKLAILSIMAAFIFGFNTTPVQAAPAGIEKAEIVRSGHAQAKLMESSEIIMLRMSSGQKQENVMVILTYNKTGSAVYEEKVPVGNNGVVIDIPLAGLKAGDYTLRANGQTINYSSQFKIK